jgi:predicted transcriptional regulator
MEEVPMPAKKRTAITVRLDPAVARRLRKISASADRSVAWTAARILEEQVAIKESHLAAIRKGMQSAEEGRLMDAEEFFAQLDREKKERRENKTNRRRSA